MSKNAIKLKLLATMRIYLVVNISWIIRYKQLVEEQKREEPKLTEVDILKELEVEKILNKRMNTKIRRQKEIQGKGNIEKL